MQFMTVTHSDLELQQIPDSLLHASEVTFQSVFKFHPEAMMLFHREHLVYVNKACCDLFGVRSGADFMMPGLDELLPPTIIDHRSLRTRFGQHIADPKHLRIPNFSWPCTALSGRAFNATVSVHSVPAMPFDLTLVRLSSGDIS
jgi:PAS domain-containing protein